jgi:6-pyruvoyltetrahydropterin/6-carboxytetrahydropterin synthase
MKVTVCRKAHFNGAHRLYNPSWDEAQNILVFGKCYNPNYHGHNYDLIVKITGEIDPQTGYVIDLGKLKRIIKENVLEVFDHKNLNIEVAAFKNLNPTVENISTVIWKILRLAIDPSLGLGIVLYETKRNYVEYNGD